LLQHLTEVNIVLKLTVVTTQINDAPEPSHLHIFVALLAYHRIKEISDTSTFGDCNPVFLCGNCPSLTKKNGPNTLKTHTNKNPNSINKKISTLIRNISQE